MSDPSVKELDEGREGFEQFQHRLAERRFSRRRSLKVASLLAIGGPGGLAALVAAACGGDDSDSDGNGDGQGGESQNPTSGAGTATGGGSGGWDDTTGLPEYKQGLPFDKANIDTKWQKYPLVYKYNWRRYNWDAPLYTGGHSVTGIATGGAPNFDLMKSPYNPYFALNLQGLWHSAIHGDLNLDGYALEQNLAEKTEHNADYTSWTFTIPENVKFQNLAPVNGRVCTAEDVVFSFERYIDSSIFATQLRNVEKITATDARTVRFDMKQPQLTFDGIVGTPYYLIFAKEHYDNPDRWKETLIGTGPYQVESNTYQDKKVNVRHPDFWQKAFWMKGANADVKLPFMDQITEQYYPNDAALVASFVGGNSDDYLINSVEPGKLKTFLTANERMENITINVNPHWATFPLGIMWSYKSKPIQDVRVRQALSMSIDRAKIMEQVFKSGVPGGGPVAFDLLDLDLPPDIADYGPNYQFNPTRAKELMKEAGYEDGLNLTMLISNTFAASLDGIRFDAINVVLQYWEQNLNVKVEFVQKDGLSVQNDQLNHSFGDMCMLPPVIGGDAYSLMSPILRTGGGANYGELSDPELDAMLDKLGTATSPDQAKTLTKEANDRVRDQVSWLYVGWPHAAWLSQPWMHGEMQNLYTCMCYYAMGSRRFVWIDDTAPSGRGGTKV